MKEEQYHKPSDVARRLGVTRGAVYKWIKEGKIKAVRFGENAVRIPQSALEEFERNAARGLVDQGEDQDTESAKRGPGGLGWLFTH